MEEAFYLSIDRLLMMMMMIRIIYLCMCWIIKCFNRYALTFHILYISGLEKCFFSWLLYSVSENDSNYTFTSEICMVFMLVTLKAKNSDFFSSYCIWSQKIIIMALSPQKFAWPSCLSHYWERILKPRTDGLIKRECLVRTDAYGMTSQTATRH